MVTRRLAGSSPPAGGGAGAVAGRGGVVRLTTGIPAWAALVVLLVVAILAPDPIHLAAARLAALAVAVTGAALLVGRAGAADLATAAAVGAGAYLGGVASALLELPVLVGLPAGVLAGAAVGTVSGALHGRVGRILGALTSLAIGTAFVAVAGGIAAGGGVAGFHAVGLPAPGGPRVEVAVVALVLLAALAVTTMLDRCRWTAGARLAVEAPVVAAAVGRHPAGDTAAVGAVAGGLLGAGGTLLAAVDGSVIPAAYGLELAAALALAAVLGGGPPLGPVLGTLLVWGPGSVWPLVPLLGTAPPLLVMGPVGLAILALRRGRPCLTWDGRPAPEDWPVPDRAGVTPDRSRGQVAAATSCASRAPRRARSVSFPLPIAATGGAEARASVAEGGRQVTVAAGDVVALTGPNGAGKSTVLARIGGQLPDHGTVRFGEEPAPRGVRARAEAGLARSWQRPPDVPPADLLAVTLDDPASLQAARWAATTLGYDGPLAATPAGLLQLIVLAARGPAVALLDEPTDVRPERLARFVAGLAGAGTAVLVVDHRPEVVAVADRVVTIEADSGATVHQPSPAEREAPSAGRTRARDVGPAENALSPPRPPEGASRHAKLVRLHLVDPPLELTVPAGEVVELPDDDRVVAALVGTSAGNLILDGRSLRRRAPARRVRAGLGVVAGVEVAPDVSVVEHLGAVVPLDEARRLLASVPGLAARADHPAGVLSGGERRLLAWLVASAREPRAVVLDRAGTGLDGDALDWATGQVGRWREAGVALLVRPGREEERRWLTDPPPGP
jgi:ABC-type branched-subunit amino acid transport system ATPase component/ABC-type branched-subunit amino acid transport system permease subunit